MIDFDTLVLSPAMATFAQPVTIAPTVSQPGHPPYAARGVWDVRDVDVMLEDGAMLASKSYTLGIRLSEFTVAPVKGDGVTIGTNAYLVEMARPDGQGGSRLVLKALQP